MRNPLPAPIIRIASADCCRLWQLLLVLAVLLAGGGAALQPLAAQSALTLDEATVAAAGLPVLSVTTVDGEEPSYELAMRPGETWASSIKNATKVPGRMVIRKDGAVLYDSGDYLAGKSGMTIKVRGNSSALTPKKPYKLKLQKKADLLFRGDDDKYKDKDWVLVRSEYTNLNFEVGLKVGELVGVVWTPAYGHVNVFVNGEYRGLYLLMESVKANSSCRLDVDKETGYIVERDAYYWNEPACFRTELRGLYYTFKQPDGDEVTQGQIDYIKEQMDLLEQSIYDGTYPDRMDLASFAAWYLSHDLLGTLDAAGSNQYLTKYDNTPASKIGLGNLWDFDTVMRTTDDWANIHGTMGWWLYFTDLMKSPNPAFLNAYLDLYSRLEPTFFDDITAWLDQFGASATAQAIDRSRQLDHERWSYFSAQPVAEDVEKAKEWFARRHAWMDDAVVRLAHHPTAIPVLAVSRPSAAEGPFFTLDGRRLPARHRSELPRGVYICQGRKIVVP